MTEAQVDQTKREQAVELMRAAAWVEKHGCDYCDHVCEVKPPVIHTRAGGFGADWDLEAAVEFVLTADAVVWRPSIFEHDLVAEKDGQVASFQVKRPPS